jgi:peptidoglycan/LPS O-acetylase OafA/YrhL
MAVTADAEPSAVAIQPVEHAVRKYAYIDALRGYAVLLVITSHTGGMFSQLPYPIKKLTNVGWHGVQLFFLVSCVTLLMSWRSDERKGIANEASFWLRRFFRIAPMYYLAAIFYFFVEPPPTGFNLTQLLASMFFVNAWRPNWISTIPNDWRVVPGGWSIGVEFTFYFLFPLMARYVRSLRSAGIFFGAAVVVAGVANTVVFPNLLAAYGEPTTSEFLYFWFPNQLPIFALGTILFFLIDDLKSGKMPTLATSIRSWRWAIVVASAVAFASLAEAQQLVAVRFSLVPFSPVPALLMASGIFIAVVLLFADDPNNILINRPICALGEVSFSAYLLHFFVIHQFVHRLPSIFDATASGYRAIAICAGLWIVVVPVTFALSWVTFRAIEKPMIGFGRTVLDRIKQRPAQALESASN